jgi:hypothetical protein
MEPQADSAFRMARRVEPHRIEDLDIYSTVLWHLRQETALSYLAHEVCVCVCVCVCVFVCLFIYIYIYMCVSM